jgi:hypothetical protein
LGRDHHIAGAPDRTGQVVVVFLCGGVGEQDVERDHLGLRGGQHVYGARNHLP